MNKEMIELDIVARQIAAKDVFGAAVNIDFDPAFVAYDSFELGNFFGKKAMCLCSVAPSNKGRLLVGISLKKGDKPTGGNGTLITLRFKALKAGETNFKLAKAKLKTAQNKDIGGIAWTSGSAVVKSAALMGPSVSDPASSPAQATPGGRVLLTARITDPDGIASAVVDCRPIGGAKDQRMYDDGSHGDEKSGDGIFSCRAQVAKGTALGHKALPIAAADASPRRNVTADTGIALEVVVAKNWWQKAVGISVVFCGAAAGFAWKRVQRKGVK